MMGTTSSTPLNPPQQPPLFLPLVRPVLALTLSSYHVRTPLSEAGNAASYIRSSATTSCAGNDSTEHHSWVTVHSPPLPVPALPATTTAMPLRPMPILISRPKSLSEYFVCSKAAASISAHSIPRHRVV
eukprot:scpid68731/ scgid30828/ 